MQTRPAHLHVPRDHRDHRRGSCIAWPFVCGGGGFYLSVSGLGSPLYRELSWAFELGLELLGPGALRTEVHSWGRSEGASQALMIPQICKQEKAEIEDLIRGCLLGEGVSEDENS